PSALARLAGVLRPRRDRRDLHPPRPPARSREPPVALPARTGGGGASAGGQHRAGGERPRRGRPRRPPPPAGRPPPRAPPSGPRPAPLLPAPAPCRPGADPDGRPGVRLQRGLLHLRPGPWTLLRCPRRPHRPVPPAVRSGEPPRTAPPRTPVRHRGSTPDDRLD